MNLWTIGNLLGRTFQVLRNEVIYPDNYLEV